MSLRHAEKPSFTQKLGFYLNNCQVVEFLQRFYTEVIVCLSPDVNLLTIEKISIKKEIKNVEKIIGDCITCPG